MTMRRTVPILLFSLLTSCGLLSHKPSRFYSLDRIPPTGPVATVRGLPVGLDIAELPPGLDRKEIVVRQADHRLEIRGLEQWTASLGALVLHTLAFDLAARFPEGKVVLPGETRPLGSVRSIDVVFEELAPGPDRSVILDARWSLKEKGQPDLAHHERITIPLPSFDSAAIATGMSQALAGLADRIAAQIP